MVNFNLPELGENVTAGDVLRVLVKPGDTLVKDQTVLELETDKATIEVPSSVAGQVRDVNEVAGSGPAGRISVEDVKAHAKRLVTAGAAVAGGTAAAGPLPDFSRWGEVARQPMRAVRRKTAEHLSAAWTTIPHVTQHDLADVTVLEQLRKRYAQQAETAGGNLTVTAIAVKVAAAALKVFPQVNTSIDLANET